MAMVARLPSQLPIQGAHLTHEQLVSFRCSMNFLSSSLRQCEKLLELRDDAEYYSSVRGFSVQSLIKSCWHARDDLDSEDDRNVSPGQF